jgi:hypothetical protein
LYFKYSIWHCMLNTNTFWLQIDFISCILCIHALYNINMNNFYWSHIFKICNCQCQKHFWTKCIQMGYKFFFISSSPFAFLIINVKVFFNFLKEWCTFGSKKRCSKKLRIVHFWGLSALNMQKHFLFVSNFEHVNFVINEKYSQKNYDYPNYYASFVIFQTYKNVFLRSVHSLEWLLWLCFCPPLQTILYQCKSPFKFRADCKCKVTPLE